MNIATRAALALSILSTLAPLAAKRRAGLPELRLVRQRRPRDERYGHDLQAR